MRSRTDAPREQRSWRPVAQVRGALWSVPPRLALSAIYTLLLVLTLSLVGVLVYTQQQDFLVQDAAMRLEQSAIRIVSTPGMSVPGRRWSAAAWGW